MIGKEHIKLINPAFHDHAKLALSIECPKCGERFHLEIEALGFYRWSAKEAIDKALPDIGTAEQAALILGLCKACYSKGNIR